MFHWLKAIGGSIDSAYETFKQYEGKASYTKLGLGLPTPMEKDDDYTSEWSHMSDYDAMGLSPGQEDYQKQDDIRCGHDEMGQLLDTRELVQDHTTTVETDPTKGSSLPHYHHENSKNRMEQSYDVNESTCSCECANELPEEGCHETMEIKNCDKNGGKMTHVKIRDDIELTGRSRNRNTIVRGTKKRSSARPTRL